MCVGAIPAPLVARAMARSKPSFSNLSQRTQVQVQEVHEIQEVQLQEVQEVQVQKIQVQESKP